MTEKEITRFAFLGDPQCDRLTEKKNDYSKWGTLLRRAYQEISPDRLIILGGDLVNRTDDDGEWEAFFAAGGDVLQEAKILTPTGNHDRNSSYEKYFDLPANGPEGAETRFFSYEYGPVHVMVLDTNLLETRDSYKVKKYQAWMEEDLAKTKATVRIVVMHHPMFSLGSSFDDDIRAAIMQQHYLPVFEEDGVDFILCGHQHVYSRREEENGITQLMGVSGGKYHKAYRKKQLAAVAENVSVATIFEIDGKTIWIRTIDDAGREIDRWEKDACGPRKRRTRRRKPEAAKCETEKSALIIQGAGIREPARFTFEELSGQGRFVKQICTYSVFRVSTWEECLECGIALEDVLNAAGWTGEGDGVLITDEDGIDVAMHLRKILNAKWFSEPDASKETAEEKAPALITFSGNSLRLVFGQQYPEDRNRRRWVKRLAKMEILKLEEFLDREAAEHLEMIGNDGFPIPEAES